MVVATFLGIAVAVMAIIGMWLAISASQARDDAEAAAAKVERRRRATPADASARRREQQARSMTPSFAGTAPANADEIAAAHTAFPAAMPALQPGPAIDVKLDARARDGLDRAGHQL